MKFSSNFLLFVFLIFLVFACEQEDTAPTEQTLDSKARIEQYVKQYLEQYGQPKVEYTSLEALNELFVANGLPIVTLEELGVTLEQYEAAQERIKAIATGTAIESRCDDPVYQILGDIDGFNGLDGNDVALAQMIILGTSTQSPRLFGCLSDHAGWQSNTGCVLTIADLVIARKVILGFSCDQI